MHAVLQIFLGLLVCVVVLLGTGYFFISPSKSVEMQFSSTPDYVGGQTYVVPIIKGVLPMSESEIIISTTNYAAPQYIKLPPSNNVEGGAQYSYTFWINRKEMTSSAVKGKPIFMRGVNQKALVLTPGRMTDPTAIATPDKMKIGDNTFNVANKVNTATVVKAPLVRFGDSATEAQNELVVEFNSLQDYNHIIRIKPDVYVNGAASWVMVTLTFQDLIDVYGNPSGVLFRAFVNDTEAINGSVATDALRLTDGPIHILPQMDSTDTGDRRSALTGAIADIVYYNYALGQEEVRTIYTSGFNSGAYQTPSDRASSNLKNQYYRLSLSSEVEQL